MKKKLNEFKVNDTFKFDKPGDKISGIFKGSRNIFVGSRKVLIHDIKTTDKEVSLWGCATLDRYLPLITEGTKIEIEYKGLKKTKNGYTVKEFDIFQID